jgi:hypothetical protein
MRHVSAKFMPHLLTDDQKVNRYLAKHQTSIVPHPPYSLDSDPADFFLFPKLKTTLKGHHFQTVEVILENAIRELHVVTESVFQKAFQQWKCW